MPVLTAAQRDVLIEHLDGTAPIIHTFPKSADSRERWRFALRANCVAGMLRSGLLRMPPSKHPTHTIITEAGREALAKALADWADALARADPLGAEIARFRRTSREHDAEKERIFP